MKLPGCQSAFVARGKIEDYLLKLEHPIGGGKAKFFLRFGFSRGNWEAMADALRKHAEENEVAKHLTDADGTTYLIDGKLHTPSGQNPSVRTVWLIETGKLAPRFITAYPL
jgi:hypothetical protein